ncbi:PREDICTED: FERM, RhoGEF and pleckstrin domain-containing protein 1-like [Tinamus guttatus]|uniref:FERM, RhoGEF and pleckstrin domain-containing protein 1-like n=1 Tax=Tinamus guttatus TaxID=94827 RepID=UPI00052F146C|nr:PREDICTED: FERM, RhoGEF and pleckstrin domain-containing protein 1-like [Tinamus guttatus]
MGETEQRPTAGSRLGAQENAGISTLEHGQKPPMTPPGKLVSIKIQMLDDTQETFDIPVSTRRLGGLKIFQGFLEVDDFKPVLVLLQICDSLLASEFML